MEWSDLAILEPGGIVTFQQLGLQTTLYSIMIIMTKNGRA